MSVREPGVHVRFFKMAMLHGVQSQAAGRQIYIDKDHVEIIVAGQDKQKFVGPVNEQHKERFPEEWARYQAGEQAEQIGTPLEQWPEVTPSQIAMLKNLNVFTVENAASLSDENVKNLGPGGYKLRDNAKRYLSVAANVADAARMSEIEAALAEAKKREAEKDAQLAELKAQVAELVLAAKPKSKKEKAVEPS